MAWQHDGFDVHQQCNDTRAYEALCKASAAGYTCVDTANSARYQNDVGRAIRGCSTLSRDKLFVSTEGCWSAGQHGDHDSHAECPRSS